MPLEFNRLQKFRETLKPVFEKVTHTNPITGEPDPIPLTQEEITKYRPIIIKH